ncbi:MAG: PAS domain-containing protein [Desulfovermiculus sp.]|nr:PAS domain-containing protein [Desulfovermiculus sp.]
MSFHMPDFMDSGSSASCFLLLGYISYLLGANYLSNMQLHSTAQERFILEVEQQAKSIGYYFSERIRDLDRLAERPEVKNYFANKALGMTMKYGLAASLERIHNLFENFQQRHRGYKSTHWNRIVFLNTQGEDLVVVEDNRQQTWDPNKFLFKELLVQKTQIVSMSSRHERTAIISGPVFFKGRHAGQLVAWCSIEGILHTPDIQVANSVKQYWALMGSEQILSLSDQESPVPLESLHSWVSIHAAQNSSNYIHRYDGYIAACAPVKGTPYRFVSVLPSRFVFGNTHPWRFFIGILATIGLGLLVLMVILRHREQRDHLSKLKESQERLEVALQGGNLGIWDWNVQTGIINFNDRCKQILGYELQGNEVHINSWNDRIHPEKVKSSLSLMLVLWSARWASRRYLPQPQPRSGPEKSLPVEPSAPYMPNRRIKSRLYPPRICIKQTSFFRRLFHSR